MPYPNFDFSPGHRRPPFFLYTWQKTREGDWYAWLETTAKGQGARAATEQEAIDQLLKYFGRSVEIGEDVEKLAQGLRVRHVWVS